MLGFGMSSPSSIPLPVDTWIGHFEIKEILGQGGFGISYKAYDSQLDRFVVLKEHYPPSICKRKGKAQIVPLNPECAELYEQSLDSFVKEAVVLAMFRDHGIPAIHDVFTSNDTAYLVLSFTDGVALDMWAKQRTPHKVRHTERILQDMLRILAILHNQRVLHRDIKPSNILIQKEDKPVLIDFGTARVIDKQCDVTQYFAGAFSPPEYADPKHCGPWSDLYSLAASFSQIILPRPLDQAIVCHATHPTLTQIFSKTFLESLDRALHPHPKKRYINAELWLCELAGKTLRSDTMNPEQPS